MSFSRFLAARLTALLMAFVGPCVAMAGEDALSPAAQETFFEEKVRPVLVTYCHKCHGAAKQESGLRLDSRAAVLFGADGGQVVEPGKPEKSSLVAAVRRSGDLKMPPDEKLSGEQVEALATWIKLGLPWPKEGTNVGPPRTARERIEHDRGSHWAYQPVRPPQLPIVKDPAWPATAVDAFVLARLEAAGLAPSPAADRRVLIRRVTFDLLGLPPTPAEVEAFLADEAPDAYARLVDRLLASPHYGERWGRHWLDVARYADTKGYAFAQERKYPYSYTYRDYVISAFNCDLPYDRFVLEQLAADRLELADKRDLAALGLLTVGRKFNNRHDDIDDQIDMVCRGLLGLTVACARCHDHKYDAVPTEDYYSLYGVFASTKEPDDLPVIAPPDETAQYAVFKQGLDERRAVLEKFAAAELAEVQETARQRTGDYLARVASTPAETSPRRRGSSSLDRSELRPKVVEKWRAYLSPQAAPGHAALSPWHEIQKLPEQGFAEKWGELLARLSALPEGTAQGQVNPLVKRALTAEPPQNRADAARVYGTLLADAYAAWKEAGANKESLAKLSPEQRQLAEMLVAESTPTNIPRGELVEYLSRDKKNKYRELEKEIKTYEANSPGAPARAMVLVDNPQPHEPRVFIRGNEGRQGNQVPRQFVGVLTAGPRQPFKNGSGRLELAQAIVDPENPLTARVIVNRVWMHHFGEPLVTTPSDFGVRSAPPSHPELLDYLAWTLRESGWSLKALHRQLVLSSAYQQASNDRPDCRAVDSENRLYWRMNRRRLEFEALRDAALAAAGRLDETFSGRPVEITDAKNRRRTVYGFIDRQDLPGLLRVFDFASPDQSSASRPRTTVPQQALFLMNSSFAIEQGKALVSRAEIGSATETPARISALYKLLFGRDPRPEESAIGTEFLAAAAEDKSVSTKLTPWEQYAQLLVLTNEFLFID